MLSTRRREQRYIGNDPASLFCLETGWEGKKKGEGGSSQRQENGCDGDGKKNKRILFLSQFPVLSSI